MPPKPRTYSRPVDARPTSGAFLRYCPEHHAPAVESLKSDVVWCEVGSHRIERPLVVEGKTLRVVEME